MDLVFFFFFDTKNDNVCYNCFGVSAHYRTRGGEWRGGIAATPHFYMVSVVRKGINEWRKQQPVNLSLTNRLDFAGRPVPADNPNLFLEVRHV
jgi:hypothetical protein